jgi:uncharacterized membrane protein
MQYTIFTTILLGIFFVASSYFIYYIFQRLKIKIDEKLLIGIIPWVVASAFVRVIEDAGAYPDTIFTVTPGIVVLFMAFLIPVLVIGKYIENKKKFPLWKTLAVTGTIAVLINVPLLKITNWYGAGLIFVTFAAILGIMVLANRLIKADKLSFWAIGAHMLDASATFVSLSVFGYGEQHVLPTFLIDVAGPWIMFPLKLAVLIPVVYFLNKKCDDVEIRKFLLIAIIVLGLAPGLRDMLRLAAGV